MSGGSSDGVLRQVHRLFNLGAVGTMTDAQLLDWFISQRDEAAEAAFEELMNRHGQQYGVNSSPVIIVIDAAGEIAFRSDTAAGDGNLTALFRQIMANPKTITDEKAIDVIHKALAEEIERVLK